MEVKLTLFDEATSKTIEIRGKLDKRERKVLEGFTQEVSHLIETNFVKNNMSAKLHINWIEGQKLNCSTDLPPKSDIAELLQTIRPMILSSEFCSFENTAGVIGKNFKQVFIWKTLKKIREHYEGKQLQSLIDIKSKTISLISEDFLFKWLNAYQYHRDLSKQKDLEPILKFLPRDSVDAICTFLLSEKIRAIAQLDDIVSLILGNIKQIKTLRKK